MKKSITHLYALPLTLFMCLVLLLSGFAYQRDELECDQESNINCDQWSNNELIIANVNVVDVAKRTIKAGQNVIIKDGLIAGIEPASSYSNYEAAQIVDAKGGYLTPGLIDMHVHAYDQSAFELSLSHGVTHVRVMNGVKQHLTWREEQKQGWLASSMTVSSPIVRSGEESLPLNWTVNTDEEARAVINTAKHQGYDLIKVYGSISKPALQALLHEAERLNMPVAKHGPHPVNGMEWHSLKGMQSLEHVEDIYQGPLNFKFDQEKLDATITNLKYADVPVTPTLHIFWQLTQLSQNKQDFLDGLPRDYISPIIAWEAKGNQVARWLNSSDNMAKHNQNTLALLKKITGELHGNDVPLLVGSDAGVLLSPHGLSTHNELKLMKESGLDSFDVLRAATINPAKALKLENRLGQIKVGLSADLILSSQNPIENIDVLKSPDAVIKEGRWLSKGDLQRLRDKAISTRSWWQEFWVLLTNY